MCGGSQGRGAAAPVCWKLILELAENATQVVSRLSSVVREEGQRQVFEGMDAKSLTNRLGVAYVRRLTTDNR